MVSAFPVETFFRVAACVLLHTANLRANIQARSNRRAAPLNLHSAARFSPGLQIAFDKSFFLAYEKPALKAIVPQLEIVKTSL
jgi:hypothetical protein